MSTILLAISAAFVVLAVPVGAWRARMFGPPVATAAVAHGLRFAVYGFLPALVAAIAWRIGENATIERLTLSRVPPPSGPVPWEAIRDMLAGRLPPPMDAQLSGILTAYRQAADASVAMLLTTLVIFVITSGLYAWSTIGEDPDVGRQLRRAVPVMLAATAALVIATVVLRPFG